jgi:phosphoglucosamine mutase
MGKLPGNTIVATVMSNLGLERALAAQGARSCARRWAIATSSRRCGRAATRSAASSRGTSCSSITPRPGDGIVAALQVLAVMLETGKPLSELARTAMTRVPQVLENATFARRLPIDVMPKTKVAIAKVESALGNTGRVLVRWSGTEAKLRVMVEGEDQGKILTFAKDIVSAATADIGA